MGLFIEIKKFIGKLSFVQKYLLILLMAMVLYIPLMHGYVNSHDEIWTILVTQRPFAEMIKIIASDDGSPPLYYLYERLWNIDGAELNVFWARCSNLFVLFLTTLLGIFPIRRLFGNSISLLFCALIFVMPPSYVLSTNIRGYALSGFLVCGVFVYSLCLAYKRKMSDWVWLTLFSILCTYNHYLCGLWIILIWSALLVVYVAKKQYRNIAVMFLCGVIVCLAYIPWLLVFIKQYHSMKNMWYPSTLYVEKASLGFLLVFESWSFWAVTVAAFCWSLILQTSLDRKHKQLDAVAIWHFLFVSLTFYFITMMISIFVRPMMTNRYLLPFLPMFYMATALALKHFPKFAKILPLFLIPAIMVAYENALNLAKDATWGNLVEYVHNNAGKNSLIVSDDSCGYLLSKYYLSEYDNVYAMKSQYLVLFQDDVKKNQSINRDYNQYESIYLISTPSKDCNMMFSPILQSPVCLTKITPEAASEMVKKGNKNLELSYH